MESLLVAFIGKLSRCEWFLEMMWKATSLKIQLPLATSLKVVVVAVVVVVVVMMKVVLNFSSASK